MTVNDSLPLHLHPTTSRSSHLPHHHRHHHHHHPRHHPVTATPQTSAFSPIPGSGRDSGNMGAHRAEAGGGGGVPLGGQAVVFQPDVPFPSPDQYLLQGGGRGKGAEEEEHVRQVVVLPTDRPRHPHPYYPAADPHPHHNQHPHHPPFPTYPTVLDDVVAHPYPNSYPAVVVEANPYQPHYPGLGGVVNANPYLPGGVGGGDLWGSWGNGSLQLNMTVWGAGEAGGEGPGGEEDRFNWGILLLAPLVVFGIGGNTLVILAISLERRLQNVTNYFLLSLAVTDLLVSLIVMPFSIINEFTGRWLFGLILCNLFVTADVLMCTSSILHLCTISLERYIGIRYPLWAQNKNKSKGAVLFKIVLVWTLALAITSPITVLGMLDDANILQGGQCLLANQHFIIYGSIFAFFIPLTIMVVMYALTVRMLNKQAKLCSGGGGGGGGGVSGAGPGHGQHDSQMTIRRSTSRKQWQRQTRHTVVGAPGTSYRHAGSKGNKDALTAASSSQGPSPQFMPRFQPLTKRNTLPRYHHERSLPHAQPSSSPQSSSRPADEFEYCNGDGGDSKGSDEVLGNGSATTTPASKWRRLARKGRAAQLKAQDEEAVVGGGEATQLKEMVQKQHMAVKAANILLMRKDLTRKDNNTSSSSVQTEQRASKVLGVVFMIFVVCWAPFFLVNILTVLCASCYFPPTLFTVFVWLGYVSSTLNPIIYTVFNKIFKLTFLKLLCCRYSHLQRGWRRGHQRHSRHSAPMGLVARNGHARSPAPSSHRGGLVICNPHCRLDVSSTNVEESMC
ncbi:D(2) dopamine receptor-like [Babylonia areolata]|uniref:D(2) dopamine receptor-like n=1 Tax=Babylonia areolata TaxID=304850 RepID=UPI003FD23028